MNIFGLFKASQHPDPEPVKFDDEYFAQDNEYAVFWANRDEDEDDFDVDEFDLDLDNLEQNDEDYSGLDDFFADMENDD